MKKNYLLLLVFVLLSLSVQGSHSQSTSNLSTSDKQETVLKSVVAKKKDFIGKKVENVYDFLVQKKDFIINHVNTDTTSPWAPDSDGKNVFDEPYPLFEDLPRDYLWRGILRA